MLQSKLRAGQLDREITFITPTITDGVANSDFISGWTEVVTVWAKKTDLTGYEVVQDDQIRYTQPANWTIRYITGLTESMRLVYDGKIYEIHSIIPNEGSRERWLDVVTKFLINVTT
jgi:SPP1 family predicted phage head-tail adaptor